MMKKTDLFQVTASSNLEKKSQIQIPAPQTSATSAAAQAIPRNDSHGTSKDNAFGAVAAQQINPSSSLMLEKQHSGSGQPGGQPSSGASGAQPSFSKQLKIQQIYSDQASQAMHHGQVSGCISGIQPQVVQTFLSGPSVSGQAPSQTTVQNIGWGDRQDNSGSHHQHVSAAHQILQSRPIAATTNVSHQAAAGVLTTRDSQYNHKTKASAMQQIFEKQNSSNIFPGSTTNTVIKDPQGSNSAITGEATKGSTGVQQQTGTEIKNSAFQSMRSRSPSNFLIWGHHTSSTQNAVGKKKTSSGGVGPAAGVSQQSNAGAISSTNMGLALKMHPISDSKRQQQTTASGVMGSGQTGAGSGSGTGAAAGHKRGQSYGSSFGWAASGNTVIESGSGNNPTQQQAAQVHPQQRAAGKASGLTYVLTQAGKQQQINFNNPRYKSTFGTAAGSNTNTGGWGDSLTSSAASYVNHQSAFATSFLAGSTPATQSSNAANNAAAGANSTERGGQNNQGQNLGASSNNNSSNNQAVNSGSGGLQANSINLTNTIESVDHHSGQTADQTQSLSATVTGEQQQMMQSQSNSSQFRVSGSFGASANSKYAAARERSTIEAQNPKPQVIGSSHHMQGGHSGPAKRISNRLNKAGHHHLGVVGKQQLAMQDSGLQVMGLSVQSNKPDSSQQQMLQTQTLTNTMTSQVQQAAMDTSMTAEDHQQQMLEMTPDQSSKDKYKKQRLIVAAQSDTGTSLIKAPMHAKAQPNSVFLSQQDQALYQHKRHAAADDSAHAVVPQHNNNRRAESMGKQKLQSKFASSKGADEHGSLEGFLQVKNLQHQTQESFTLRTTGGNKTNRHTNSFQGGIRPLKNAPFKPKQTNSTTNSQQLNDSGHGSGGNATNSLTTTVNINMHHSIGTAETGTSGNKFGAGGQTTTQTTTSLLQQSSNSDRDNHYGMVLQNSHIKSRLIVPQNQTTSTSNHPAIFLHPTIQNRNKQHNKFSSHHPAFNNPSQQNQKPHLSPAPPHNRSKLLIVSQQTSETGPTNQQQQQILQGGADLKMQQLHQQFTLEKQSQHLHYKNQLAPAAAPSSPRGASYMMQQQQQQLTPISSNRKTKKASLVFRDAEAAFKDKHHQQQPSQLNQQNLTQQNTGSQTQPQQQQQPGTTTTTTTQAQGATTTTNKNQYIHKLKNMIRQTKKINQLDKSLGSSNNNFQPQPSHYNQLKQVPLNPPPSGIFQQNQNRNSATTVGDGIIKPNTSSYHLQQQAMVAFQSQQQHSNQKDHHTAASAGITMATPAQHAATNPQQLQRLQEQILRSKVDIDSSSDDDDDTLSRDDGPTGMLGACVSDAMAIVQGYTPSGLATSTPQQYQDLSSVQQQMSGGSGVAAGINSETPDKFQQPREFCIGVDQDDQNPEDHQLDQKEDEIIGKATKRTAVAAGGKIGTTAGTKDLNLNNTPVPPFFGRQQQQAAAANNIKDITKNNQTNAAAVASEQKKLPQLFSKTSKERQQRESENYSKNQSSSGSSFQQAFEQIISESESLKWQLEEILFRRMTPSDPKYYQFIDRVVATHKERQQQRTFFKSMPAKRQQDNSNALLNVEVRFTRELIEQHIENEKKRLSENLVWRPFHSDMSRSRFFSNSVRGAEDHPSITSPNWSGTVGRGTGYGGLQRHLNRHERKRRLHRYLSFSNGVTYHAKSAQNSNLLPELSGGEAHLRNSFCQLGLGGRPNFFGVSDSQSSRVYTTNMNQYGLNSAGGILAAVNNNSSNSNQTATPVQQQESSKKKLADDLVNDATKRVQILPPAMQQQEQTNQGESSGLKPVGATVGIPEGGPTEAKKQTTVTTNKASIPTSSNLQMIYEKLNMNDRKKIAQFNNAVTMIPSQIHFQQAKQENNFFTTSVASQSASAQPSQVVSNTPAQQIQTQQPETAAVATANKIFGKNIEWQMGKQLGCGTTGEVYEALNIDNGQTFAVKMIKLMHPYLGLDQQKVKSVKKEIQRYKQLQHRHIVKYYDSEIIENNVLCIYLEYVYKSIAQMCKEYGRIGEKNARMYTQQALKALDYLHSQNVTHGDLKGANVLVSQDGKEIKLCDMGNSLMLKPPPAASSAPVDLQASSGSLLSVQSMIARSPAWMAPETHYQRVGRKSDIWSLGCLVVEMVSGQNPWGNRLDSDSNAHIALQQRLANLERPEIPDHVSEECQNFIDRCLQHNSSQRPSASELLDDPWIKNKDQHGGGVVGGSGSGGAAAAGNATTGRGALSPKRR